MNDKDEECTKDMASRLLESGWRWLDPEWKLVIDINSTV
jgi:glutathionylspermidine synthase